MDFICWCTMYNKLCGKESQFYRKVSVNEGVSILEYLWNFDLIHKLLIALWKYDSSTKAISFNTSGEIWGRDGTSQLVFLG